ncbi:MAG: hypothetical protein R3E39_20590 [Anaerolineae bacterium]
MQQTLQRHTPPSAANKIRLLVGLPFSLRSLWHQRLPLAIAEIAAIFAGTNVSDVTKTMSDIDDIYDKRRYLL